MIKSVLNYIKEYGMIEENDIVIAGVSGGADSVCLLRVLLEIRNIIPIAIHVVHVEHGIRGQEAWQDMEFVKALCEKFAVTCTVYHYDIPKIAAERKISEEEAGRLIRYETFEKEKEKYDHLGTVKIAVAHNKNDNAETVLLNLVRGSGIAGLSGIMPVRGSIIRPLLDKERYQIEEYLEEIHQNYQIDSTNLGNDYARNRIRHNILTEMEKVNSGAIKNINSASRKIAQAGDFLSKILKKEFESIVAVVHNEWCLDMEKLNKADDYVKNQVVLQALYQCAGSRKDIGQVHVEAVLGLLGKESGKQLSLPYEIKAFRTYGNIRLKKKCLKENCEAFEVLINGQGQYNIPYRTESFEVILENIDEKNKKNLNIEQKTYTKCFDYGKIENGLVIRTRRTGDFLVIDKEGHKQSLKSYFINHKIKREQRDQILLVADGSHIVWVVGYRISFDYKINDTTKKVVKIQMTGENKNE